MPVHIVRGPCANGDVLAGIAVFLSARVARQVVESITLKRERFCARITDW
ncbi:hypothetical protein ABID76_002573 [Burkholderia ambifaria]